jgi:hypothetical protein
MLRALRVFVTMFLFALFTPWSVTLALEQPATPVVSATAEPVDVRVMTFNVWGSGALEPSDYETRLKPDDGYVVLAVAPFTVDEDG